MEQQKTSSSWMPRALRWLVAVGIIAFCFTPLIYTGGGVAYTETKGPFKNWMQVVDWEGDGDLDLIVNHTRWEDVDISWAGIGIWINQGDSAFELMRDRGTGTYPFGGFAAGASDIDQDGDLDVFTQSVGIHLVLNQGGRQEGERGQYVAIGGINAPPAYHQGYRDMGATITTGDLNGDGQPDAFVAGCCYGLNARRRGYGSTNAPSVSWVWINGGGLGTKLQTGHTLPLDALDGRPIRQVALGDLDGDGDLDIYAAVGDPTMGTTESVGDLVLLNDGTGRLAAHGQPLGHANSTAVALGDVNGNGRLDALVGTSKGATLWLNQGDAMPGDGPRVVSAEQSFDAVQTVARRLQAGVSATADRLLGLYLPYGSIRTKAVFLADLDGGGDLDVLLARLFSAEIWLNDGQGGFTVPAGALTIRRTPA